MKPQIIVMGVAGCGKSTIGQLLANHMGAKFIDGDALHPTVNIEKMRQAIPLTDQDRIPWLQRVGENLSNSYFDKGVVIACSALKRDYRRLILEAAPHAKFIYLQVSQETLKSRLEARQGHFVDARLLESQLAILEPLVDTEHGFTINAEKSPADVCKEVIENFEF